MLWFLDLARHAGVEVLSYRDEAQGILGRNDLGRPALTRIVLRPRIAYAADPGAAEVARLHHAAHENCFIANSLRTEVVVE
jgi:organic hydroperoxide reductase OsmC/OhrA